MNDANGSQTKNEFSIEEETKKDIINRSSIKISNKEEI